MALTLVNHSKFNGGTYLDVPFRIVIHSTEFEIPSDAVGQITRHAYPPHVWYDPSSRRGYKSVDFGKSAFALKHRSWEPHTNKMGALQVEVYGRAASLHTLSEAELRNIALDVVVPFAEFAASKGKPINLSNVITERSSSSGYGYAAPQRGSWDWWRTFDGICGHRHVPGNSHWDPGGLNIEKIAYYARVALDLKNGGFSMADVETVLAKLTEIHEDLNKSLVLIDRKAQRSVDVLEAYISNRNTVQLPDGREVPQRARIEDFVRRAVMDVAPTVVGMIEFPEPIDLDTELVVGDSEIDYELLSDMVVDKLADRLSN